MLKIGFLRSLYREYIKLHTAEKTYKVNCNFKGTSMEYFLVFPNKSCYIKTSFELLALKAFFIYKKILEKVLKISIILDFLSSCLVKGRIKCFHWGNKDREEVILLGKLSS